MTTSHISISERVQRGLMLLHGILLAAMVAWLGMQSSTWIGTRLLGFEKSPISGIMMAIVLGLLIRNLITLPARVKPGIAFSLKWLLRLGIILLGIRLSLGDVLRLGVLGIPLILFCMAGALGVTRWLGDRLHLSARMSALIAVGTSICGATAIVAIAPAIDAEDEEITYAIANITLFGVLAMFLYPLLAHGLFAGSATEAGLFLGTAIHETAQVAGSGLIYEQLYNSAAVLDTATVTKLVRNVLIAVIVPLIAYQHHQRRRTAQPSESRTSFLSLFPTFILGFLVMALVRTVGDVTLESGRAWGVFDVAAWDHLTTLIRDWAENLLAIAMAGVGLGTGFQQLRGLGLRPFYVGLAAAVAVGGLSLIGIAVFSAVGLV